MKAGRHEFTLNGGGVCESNTPRTIKIAPRAGLKPGAATRLHSPPKQRFIFYYPFPFSASAQWQKTEKIFNVNVHWKR